MVALHLPIWVIMMKMHVCSLKIFTLIAMLILTSCGSKLEYTPVLSELGNTLGNDQSSEILLVSIEQSSSQDDPTSTAEIFFNVSFSNNIEPASFTADDITQMGSADGVTWSISKVSGSSKEFILKASGAMTDGSVIPYLNPGLVAMTNGRKNSESASYDNVVIFDQLTPTVTIEKRSSSFMGSLPVEFDIVFSEEINDSTFTLSDIVQSGTSSVTNWQLVNSGDNKNYILRATAATTGTIIPSLNALAVNDLAGNPTSASTSIDNLITYDTSLLGVAIEKSVSETVGTCTFNLQNDVTDNQNIEYKITFTEAIDPASFDASDITQSGEATVDSWTLTNCGDNQNYKLVSDTISEIGSVAPTLASSVAQKISGSGNTASTSVDNTVLYSTTLFTWTGEGADDNWSNTSNWLGGAVPATSDAVLFTDKYCTNCNALMDVNVSINEMRLESDFNGTITQALGSTFSFRERYIQDAGTFIGGDSAINAVYVAAVSRRFEVNGGSFTSTSGTFTVSLSRTLIIDNNATFNHNNGTINFTGNGEVYFTPGDEPLFNFSINKSGGYTPVFIQAPLVIDNDFYYNNTGSNGIIASSSLSKEIEVKGNVSSYGKGIVHTNLTLTGNSDQLVYSEASVGGLEIASTGGTVTLQGNPQFIIGGNRFKYTSGTYSVHPSTTSFRIESRNGDIDFPNFPFSNLSLETTNLNNLRTIKTSGSLTIDANDSSIFGGVFEVGGDVSISDSRLTSTIVLNGSADQNLSLGGIYYPRGKFEVNKTGGQVIQQTNATLNQNNASQDLEIINGVWNMNGFDLFVHDQLNIGDSVGAASSARLLTNCGTISAGTQTVDPVDGEISNSTSNPNISINDLSTSEGSDAVFTVSLSEPVCGSDFTIDYNTIAKTARASEDFTYITNTLTIPSGNSSATVTVSTIDDTNFEVEEDFSLIISNHSHGVITKESGVGTITDNDSPTHIWTGLGGDDNWSTGANWSGGSSPGSGSVVVFDNTCTNCNSVVDTNFSVGSVNILNNYSGALNLSSGISLNVSYIRHHGGDFNLFDGNLNFNRGYEYKGGNFNAGTSTVASSSNTHTYADFGSMGPFYNFRVNHISSSRLTTATSPVVISNELTVISGGGTTFEVAGDVIVDATVNTGPSVILNGSTNQSVTTSSRGNLSSIEFASTGGVISVRGDIGIANDINYTSGTVDLVGSNFIVIGNGASSINTGSSLRFDNLTSQKQFAGSLTIINDLYVDGVLSVSGRGFAGTGPEIYLSGDLVYQPTPSTNGAPINFIGTADQTISLGSIGQIPGTLKLNKPSGELRQLTDIAYSASWPDVIIQNGIWNMNGYDLTGVDDLFVGDGVGAAQSASLRSNCGAISADSQVVDPVDGAIETSSGNPNITIDDVSVNEGNDISFVIMYSEGVCSGSSTIDYKIKYVNASRQDFSSIAESGTLTFAAGETSKTITFSTEDDAYFEIDESFQVVLSNNSDGTITDDTAIGTITDNDPMTTFVWTGLGPDDNWSTASNWSGGVKPSSASEVLFNGTCTNCNANIDEDINVVSFLIDSDYTGTITQQSGQSMIIGGRFLETRGWQQLAGTFVGGDSQITMYGDFSLFGGVFRSTSDKLLWYAEQRVGALALKDTSFVHNNGTVELKRGEYASGYVKAFDINFLENDQIHFYNLTLNLIDIHNASTYNSLYLLLNDNEKVYVKNQFELENGEINGGEVHLAGNLRIDCVDKSANFNCAGGGSTKIIFNGNSAQEYTLITDGHAPIIVVDTTGSVSPASGTTALKTSGFELLNGTFNAPNIMKISPTRNIAGTIPQTINSSSSILISSGIFNHNNGKVILEHSDIFTNGSFNVFSIDSSALAWDLYDFQLDFADLQGTDNNEHIARLASGSVINVANDFQIDNGRIEDGRININGHANFNCENAENYTDCAGGGTTELHFTTTTDQNITSEEGASAPSIVVNKTSGSVLQKGNLNLGSSSETLTLTSGTYNMAGYNLSIPGVLTLESGTTMESGCGSLSYGSLVNNGGTLNVLDSEPMTLSHAQAVEGSPLIFNIEIDRVCARDIDLHYSTSGLGNILNDITNLSGVVKLNRGDTKSSIVIETIDDSETEGNENISLSVNAKNLGGGFSLISNGEIVDNDSSGILIKKASIGEDFMCVLYTDGSVKCLGHRSGGRLADGSGGDIGVYASDMGDGLPAVNLGTSKVATQVSQGGHHTCAILDDGYLKCWGGEFSTYVGHGLGVGKIGSYKGQMGDRLDYARVGSMKLKKVVSSSTANCAIFENDQMKCFGSNGNPFGYDDNAKNYGSGNLKGDTLPFVNVGTGLGVKDVSLSSLHACAILSNDKLKCWGSGTYGQLGSGDSASIGGNPSEVGDGIPIVDLGSNYIVKKVSVNSTFSCAILDDDINGLNNVKCWGRDSFGRLGNGDGSDDVGDDPGEMGDLLPIVDLGVGRTAKNIGTGNDFACAHLDNDTVKCWGQGFYLGQESSSSTTSTLSQGNLNAIDFGVGRSVKELSVYDQHACVILDNDQLKCWGNANNGRLGQGFEDYIGDDTGEMGDNLNPINLGTSRTAKKLSNSSPDSSFTCVILDNDELKCFGEAKYGALGIEHLSIGDDVSELSGVPVVDLGTGKKAIDIASSGKNTCVILNDGNVRCWGENYESSLPYPNAGHKPNSLGDNIPFINLGGKKALSIKAEDHSYCVLLEDNSLSCWGRDSYGKIGNNGAATSNPITVNTSSTKKILDYDVGVEASCVVYSDGTSACWGEGQYGSLANGSTADVRNPTTQLGDNIYFNEHGSKTPISVFVGRQSCFLYSDLTSRCYGPTRYGVLQPVAGLYGDEPSELNDGLAVINWGSDLILSSLSGGGGGNARTCAIFTDGRVKCSGRALAFGTGRSFSTNGPGVGTNEVGDKLPFIPLKESEKVTQVFHGSSDICLLLDSNKLRCFGNNNGYFHGVGVTDSEVGDEASEIGELANDSSVPVMTSALGTFPIIGITGGSDSTLDSFLNHTEATINWSAATGANLYKVTIYEDDKTTVACSEQSTASTAYSFTGCTLTHGNKYYVSLTAEDAGPANIQEAKNNIFPFSVNTSGPASFNILGVISDKDTLVDANLSDGYIPTLKWQSSTGAISYDITIYNDAGMSSVKCSTSTLSADNTEKIFDDCSNAFSISDDGSTFYAQVVSEDRFGNTLDAGNGPFAFTISDSSTPDAFSILGITGGADDLVVDNVLSHGSWATVNWQDTSGESSYDVTIYSDQVGTVECATVNVAMNTTSYNFDSCDLVAGNTYYAKVSAIDTFSSVDNDDGTLYEFSVGTNPLGSFTISGIEGVGGDTTVDDHLTFGNRVKVSWSASSGASNYTVKILNKDQTGRVCKEVTTSLTNHTFSDCYLKGAEEYYVSVTSDDGVDYLSAANGPYKFDIVNYPEMTLDSPTISEGGNLTFTATLSNTWPVDVSANWKIVALDAVSGVDFVRSEGTVTISASSSSQTFSITTIDDVLPELDKKLIVSLHDPENATLSNESIGIGTISDNDAGEGISSIHTGRYDSCALGSNGDIKCWGLKASGSLGLANPNIGDDTSEMGDNLAFINLPTGRHAIDVAVSSENTCILLDDASIVCIGESDGRKNGTDGDRGWLTSHLGDNLEQMTFSSGTPQKIYGGLNHYCALMTSGEVKCWGANGGRLGSGDSDNKYISEATAVDLGTGRTAKDLSLTDSNTCALLDNDMVKCWGAGNYGMNGNGSTLTIGNDPSDMGDNLFEIDFGAEDRARKIVSGNRFSCALLFNDQVKCWGRNEGATLGINVSEDIGDDVGELATSDFIDFGTGRSVKNIAAGSKLACAILDNDQVKCWGDTFSYRGRISTFGSLGDHYDILYSNRDETSGDNWPFVDLGSGRSATELVVGNYYACALLDNAEYKCWGLNDRGQLGIERNDFFVPNDLNQMGDNLPSIDLGTGRSVKKLVNRAYNHQCVLLDNDQVKCFGTAVNTDNVNPRIGHLGNASNIIIGNEASDMGVNLTKAELGTSRTAKSFFTGPSGHCAILDNDEVKCFGGRGNETFSFSDAESFVGDFASELGDNNPSLPELGSERIIKIVHGDREICFLFDDFSAACAGEDNEYFNNGRNEIIASSFARIYQEKLEVGSHRYVLDIDVNGRNVCVLLDNFKIKCFGVGSSGVNGNELSQDIGDDEGEMGDQVDFIDLGTGVRVVDIEMSAAVSACATLSDETLKCWGHYDSHGQNTHLSLGDNPGEMGASLGTVYLGASGTKVLQVVGSDTDSRFCALTEYTGVKGVRCWGRDSSRGVLGRGASGGVIGNGANEMQTLSNLDFGTGVEPIQVDLVTGHGCALLNNGQVKCWGSNLFGQLGIENEEDIGNEPGEMGDSLPAVNVSF